MNQRGDVADLGEFLCVSCQLVCVSVYVPSGGEGVFVSQQVLYLLCVLFYIQFRLDSVREAREGSLGSWVYFDIFYALFTSLV